MPSKITNWKAPAIKVGNSPVIPASRFCESHWQLDGSGNIRLDVANPHRFKRANLLKWPTLSGVAPMGGGLSGDYGSSDGPMGGFTYAPVINSVVNTAVAKFTGKLYKDAPSLGITFAEYASTGAMLAGRLRQAARAVGKTHRRLNADPKKLAKVRSRINAEKQRFIRNYRKLNPTATVAEASKAWDGDLKAAHVKAADVFLETQFGWMPLIKDIHAALSLATSVIPDHYVSGRAGTPVNFTVTNSDSNYIYRSTFQGRITVTHSAVVKIANPNIRLANYLGLVNLPGVAWDLVPWSFVVNYFSNTNQMIRSLTADLGLKITNRSTTITQWSMRDKLVSPKVPNPKRPPEFWRCLGKTKDRTLNSSAPVTWQLRAPEFSWTSAAIAGALLAQRLNALMKLVS